jgi:hypothetical protein
MSALFCFFIDESYDENCFILLGCIVNSEWIFDIEKNINDIVEEYKLKNLKDNLRGNLRIETKLNITKKLVSLMKGYNVQIIASILSYRNIEVLEKNGKLEFKPNQLNKDYKESFTFLVERFYKFLEKNNSRGIIIFDAFNMSKELRNSIKSFLEGKIALIDYLPTTRRNYYKFIYPALFLTHDEHSLILQATDLVSFSLHKGYKKCLEDKKKVSQNDIEELWKYNMFLKEYFDLFQRSENGKISGWGIKLW